jgi:hypothetical protein
MSINIGYVQFLVLIIGLWIIIFFVIFLVVEFVQLLIPVAAQSKSWVCGRSLAGTVGSNPAGGMDVCLF